MAFLDQWGCNPGGRLWVKFQLEAKDKDNFKGFRSPLHGARVTFFACPKKVTKEKTPGCLAPVGVPCARGCCGEVDRQAVPGLTIDAPRPCGAPSGFDPATPPCSASHTEQVKDSNPLALGDQEWMWETRLPWAYPMRYADPLYLRLVGARSSGRSAGPDGIARRTGLLQEIIEAGLTFPPYAAPSSAGFEGSSPKGRRRDAARRQSGHGRPVCRPPRSRATQGTRYSGCGIGVVRVKDMGNTSVQGHGLQSQRPVRGLAALFFT